MTNEELVEQIQLGINKKENLTALYEQNKGFIFHIVKPLSAYAELDDLMQEGYIGFQEAIEPFRIIEDGAKFTTYAAYKIRHNCLKYIENNDTKRIPNYLKNKIRKYNHFVSTYEAEHESEPSDELIMQQLKISQVQLENLRKAMHEQTCISIHSQVPGTEDCAMEDILADASNMIEDAEEKIYQTQLHEQMENAISNLPDRQEKIIKERYFENKTLGDIADDLMLSKERIRQIERTALKKLKQMDEVCEIRDQVYGYDSHIAYGIGRKIALDNHTSCTEQLALKRIDYEEKKTRINNQIDELFSALLEG